MLSGRTSIEFEFQMNSQGKKRKLQSYCIRRNFIFFSESLHLTTNHLFSKTPTNISLSVKSLKRNTLIVMSLTWVSISNCVCGINFSSLDGDQFVWCGWLLARGRESWAWTHSRILKTEIQMWRKDNAHEIIIHAIVISQARSYIVTTFAPYFESFSLTIRAFRW